MQRPATVPANAPLVPVGLSCDYVLMRSDDDQDEHDHQAQRVAVAAWMQEHGIVCIAQDIPPYVSIPPSDAPASEWIAQIPVTD